MTGHYSAHTNPDQLADDIRRFFRPLRTATGLTATGLDTNRAASKEN